jgi:hypothetical protein
MGKDYAKMAEALKLARVLIESGSEVYVCYALDKVGSEHEELIPSAEQVTFWISEALGTHSTVFGWSRHNGYISHNMLPADVQLKEYRLAWIDNMIQALETE